jgi:dynein light intermediate chain
MLPPRQISPHENFLVLIFLLFREWVEDSGTWAQYVSKEPASRLDVIALQEQLDKKLSERKARETGICSVREELYGQCFDELIRHVTLDGPERGLLLMRTRDEIRMTIDAYKTLFASSVTFGIKKQLRAEQGIPELESQVSDLEAQKSQLELEVYELRSKLEIVEKREAERKTADDKRRKEELDFLKYQGQHLDSFLKQMNSNK